MKRLKWLIPFAVLAALLAACSDKANTPVSDTPSPSLPPAPSATSQPTPTIPPTLPPFASGVFTPVGDLRDPRSIHIAALLPDGRVLVAGGNNSRSSSPPPVLASSEFYDPVSRAFTPGPNLAIARQTFAATTLADGRILVAGGVSASSGALASAELYDPPRGKFEPAGTLLEARAGAAAVTMKDGRALIIGGWGGGASLETTEIFDPATLTFSPGPPLAHANSTPRALLLNDGSLLVTGDGTAQFLETNTNAFRAIGDRDDLPEVPALLPDGKVLLTGGIDHQLARTLPTPVPNSDRSVPATTQAVVLDPSSGEMTEVGPMREARMLHQAITLPNGRVLLAGGVGDSHFGGGALATAEIFDPTTATFTPTGPMARGRVWFTLTLLNDGNVLAVGSGTDPPGVTAEVYHPN
ncbi:MAG: Kelch repeat-containing protein [Dehalococcoidia bacterium]